MGCRRFRRLVQTTREADRAPKLQAALGAHAARCLGCRAYARAAERVTSLLQALPPAPLADDPAPAIWARIDAHRHPHHSRLLARLFGHLRAPAPALGLRFVAVGAGAMACLAVVLSLMVARGLGGPALEPMQRLIPSAQVAALPPGTVDDLVMQHADYAGSRPFGLDSGIQLVSEPMPR